MTSRLLNDLQSKNINPQCATQIAQGMQVFPPHEAVPLIRSSFEANIQRKFIGTFVTTKNENGVENNSSGGKAGKLQLYFVLQRAFPSQGSPLELTPP